MKRFKMYNFTMKKSRKSFLFIIITFIYLGIVTYFFLQTYPQIKLPTLHTNYSPYSKTKLNEFIKYLNPYSDTIKTFTTIQHSSNLESASFYILNPYTQNERDSLISHFYKRGWSYKIYTNHVNFLKKGYLITYSSLKNSTFTEIFILKNKIANTSISNLFLVKTYPNTGSYPFTQNEMLGALDSLNNSYVGSITQNGFNYYPSNLKNVSTFKNNKVIENITGFAILNSSSKSSIGTVLQFYMNKFKIWGYIPFTVYGAIIDNNTIYYLKYGLGAATIEVKVVKHNTYSIIYYTLEVTASESNNYLLIFQKQGWQSTFN